MTISKWIPCFSFKLGVDMSPTEVSRYEAQSIFFIPSFTSTSKTRPFGCKNTLIHVDITPEWSKFCMEIQPEHTNYSQQEEILFSCYNLYRYLRTEKSNSHRIIKLELLDYHQYFDSRQNAIRSDYLRYYAIWWSRTQEHSHADVYEHEVIFYACTEESVCKERESE